MTNEATTSPSRVIINLNTTTEAINNIKNKIIET